MTDRNHLLSMRNYFETGETKSVEFRKAQLTRLKQAVIDHADQLQEALYTDLKKSPEESKKKHYFRYDEK